MLEYEIKQMIKRAQLVEDLIQRESPEIIDSVRMYNNESIQARKTISDDLNNLPPDSEILEVGAGNLGLSIQLASEGFRVYALEPISEGFTLMGLMIEKYLFVAQLENINFHYIQCDIEEFKSNKEFDYIFSINVIEHIQDLEGALISIHKKLKPKHFFRFYCSNYDFPYEPHFKKFLFHRKNSAFYLKRDRIAKSKLPDSEDLYYSLNFITYRKLLRTAKQVKFEIPPQVSPINKLADRAINDSYLRNRHKMLSIFADLIHFFRLENTLKLIPVAIQPVIDLKMSKNH